MKTRLLYRLGLGGSLWVLCCLSIACSSDNGKTGWTPAFDWPEADRLFQLDTHWQGGDGAYSIDLGGARVLWLFGDSWIHPSGRSRRKGAKMVSNSLAIQHGYDPSNATAEFFWDHPETEQTGAFFPDFDGGRYWPGNGIIVGDKLLLFLMVVYQSDKDIGFEVRDWAAVLVHNPEDNPSEWQTDWLQTPSNDRQIIVGSGGVLSVGSYVYVYGAQEPEGNHPIFLTRWKAEDLQAGKMDNMEWWSGADGWLPDSTVGQRAQPVFENSQTEFTVHLDSLSGTFVETETRGFGPATIIQRTAAAVEGPWSEAQEVFTPPEMAYPDIIIYQGKAHPHLEGAPLVLTYSTNSFKFGDQFSTNWLYYPRFVRVSSPKETDFH